MTISLERRQCAYVCRAGECTNHPPRDLDIDMLDACGAICNEVKGISGDLKEISSLVSQEMQGIQSRKSGVHEKGGRDSSSGSVDGALSGGAL